MKQKQLRRELLFLIEEREVEEYASITIRRSIYRKGVGSCME